MITRPTVFILGAGASADYGFPTGEKLQTKIYPFLKACQNTDFKFIKDAIIGSHLKLA